jgi:hypothetical protein
MFTGHGMTPNTVFIRDSCIGLSRLLVSGFVLIISQKIREMLSDHLSIMVLAVV